MGIVLLGISTFLTTPMICGQFGESFLRKTTS
jgi:hypothetical protein